MAKNELLDKGIKRIEWAKKHMPVLEKIRERMVKEKVFEGLKVGMALHTEAKTGVLALTIQEAGAEVRLTSCNPLSTDDSVALALREEYGLVNYAKKGQTPKQYYDALNKVLDIKPDYLIDDGADLIFLVHTKRKELLGRIKGANEETTTGVMRLRSMAQEGSLRFPVMSVNDAYMKYLFDNRYGTGQSTIDGILTSTNLTIAGKNFTIAGYGWCGRGIAMRADGLGGNVIVCEVDPLRALEAVMDGHRVMPAVEAAALADVWVTVTGDINVIDSPAFDAMKSGAIIANSGHFNVEINIPHLREKAASVREVRPLVEEFTLTDGRVIYLLADGRLVNLACAEGHPASVMDMSFANQALCAEFMVGNCAGMEPGVYDVPSEIDEKIAALKLASMGIEIDTLTPEQTKYLSSWEEGTV